MKLLHPRDAAEHLERTFPVPSEALDRCARILALQHESLAAAPPPVALSEAVRLAAAGRIRSGEAIIPRARFPFETGRVESLFVALVDALTETELVDDPERTRLVEAALLAARADDPPELLRAARALGATAETGVSLLREAFKPELLRTSLPLSAQLEASPPRAASGRCPACGSAAGTATRSDVACCRFCGLTWGWQPTTCAARGHDDLRRVEIAPLDGAWLQTCRDCGDVLRIFDVPADPLLLSLHAALAAPFELAMLAGSEGHEPRETVSVF